MLIPLLILGAGGYWLYTLVQADKLIPSITDIGRNTPFIKNGALQLWCTVEIDNPTNNTYTIEMPTVNVYANNSNTPIGNTISQAGTLTIKGKERLSLPKPLLFEIPLTNLPGALTALLANGTTGKQIIVEAVLKLNKAKITTRKIYEI